MFPHGESEPQIPDSEPKASGSDRTSESRCPHTEQHDLRQRISHQLVELDREEEEYIKSINRKRLELKRLWNSTLLIHKLPSELLIQVFTNLPDYFGASNPKPSSHSISGEGVSADAPPITSWPSLMLVCRCWRDLLVSTATFWRVINTRRHIDSTKLSLARSAAASLVVHIWDGDRCPLDMLYPYVHRFQKLFVTLSDWHAQGVLEPLFGSGMPLLEDLDLSDSTVGRQLAQTTDLDHYLTSRGFPRLQKLDLSQVVLPRDPSLYAQLRALSLWRCSHNSSFDGFLDALAGCVQLEELTLEHTLNGLSGEWQPIPRRPPIPLPLLRSFWLNHNGTVCASRFLAHLLIPASAHLTVMGDTLRDDGMGPDTVVHTLGALLPPTRAKTLPILSMATKISAWIMSEQWSTSVTSSIASPGDGGQGADALFTLFIDDNNIWDPWMAHGLNDLAECFTGSPLTCLELSGDHSCATVAAWKRVFRTFPLLEELVVGPGRYSELSKVFLGLHVASYDDRSEYTPAVACPNLRLVWAGGVGTEGTYAALRECFCYRADKGSRLGVLDLSMLFEGEELTLEQRCGYVEDLRQAVECVLVENNRSDEEQAGT